MSFTASFSVLCAGLDTIVGIYTFHFNSDFNLNQCMFLINVKAVRLH